MQGCDHLEPAFNKYNRINFLDTVRGICSVLMVVYHTMYNLNEIFDVPTILWDTPLLDFLHYFVIGIFLLISGICTAFSHNVFKRGLLLFILGGLLTLFTWIFLPDERIIFGILSFLGTMMLLFAPLRRQFYKVPWYISFFVLILLLLIFKDFNSKHQIHLFFSTVTLPDTLYQNDWLFFLGITSPDFFSADYFPLIPFGFAFLAGAALSVPITNRKFPGWFYTLSCRPIDFVGRHTLIVYVLHQPIVFGILWLYFRLFS